jgi:beta-glucuronidase
MSAYPHFPSRSVRSLAGVWDFSFLGGMSAADVKISQLKWNDRMAVPAAFDATPRYAGMRGLAAYRMVVDVAPHQRMRLRFDAVSFWCRVFVDGRPCGTDHRCGYTPFHRDFETGATENCEIVVLVDNRFDPASAPLHEIYYDFFQWGGIIREVTLQTLPRQFLDDVQVRVANLSSGEIEIQCMGGDRLDGSFPVEIAIDGQPAVAHNAEFSQGRAWIRTQVPDAKTWSPQSPCLHILDARLGDDWVRVRFGLRTVSVRGTEILLNGEPLRLFGFNRHEAHGQTGPSLSDDLHVHDIHLLKKLGCNFVRGSHYPQDQRFLDLCDESGILVWEEALGWQQKESHFTRESFRRAHDECLREMVSASFNHPSIIFWGFLNEAQTDAPAAVPFLEDAARLVRELDPTRLLTFASNRPHSDLCLHAVDVISLNLYPGWYESEDVEDPSDRILPGLRETISALKSGPFSDKPVFLSEIGVEALPGWHDTMDGFYTEEFQARYLETVLREIRGDPRWAGLAIWHFADARTYRGGRSIRRPRAYNNKGVFDEYRRPKLAASVLGDLLRECTGAPVP